MSETGEIPIEDGLKCPFCDSTRARRRPGAQWANCAACGVLYDAGHVEDELARRADRDELERLRAARVVLTARLTDALTAQYAREDRRTTDNAYRDARRRAEADVADLLAPFAATPAAEVPS